MNRQSNGRAAWLYRVSNAVICWASSSRLGEIVWCEEFALDHGEVDLDLVEPGRMDGGVDHDRVREGVGEPGCCGPAAVGGAVVDDPEHPPGAGVGLAAHHLGDQGGERLDTGSRGAVTDHPCLVDVVGREVGQGAVPAVLGFDQHRLPSRTGWAAGMDPLTGLHAGFLVGGDDVVIVSERFPFEGAGVQVQHSAGFEREVRVTREDPGPVLPRLIASAANQRRTVEADTDATTPRRAASTARSGQLHFASGTSEVAGSSHANAFTSATWTALNWRGRPDRGRSSRPASRRW